jgi:hypothetical protein
MVGFECAAPAESYCICLFHLQTLGMVISVLYCASLYGVSICGSREDYYYYYYVLLYRQLTLLNLT